MQNPHIDLGNYGIWTGALDFVASSAAREHAAAIEELGFGALHCWFGCHDCSVVASFELLE